MGERVRVCPRLGDGVLDPSAAATLLRYSLPAMVPSVAIKTLSSSSHDAVRREAGLLRACRGHRSIVQLRAMSSDPGADDRLSLVMEYVGPSLHHVLHGARRGCPFQEDVVRYLMRQLLGGTKHMHERCGVVHRDIKPENVLVGDGVKICDFGLAMRTSTQSPPYGLHGTRSYMAPEILLGKPDYDAKVDAWSLGCVMAEILLGDRLFGRAADDADQLLRIFYILGVPDQISWPSYNSMPLAGELVAPPPTTSTPHRNRLREMFPEDCLSIQGFQVLSGLLSCDAHKRLSAADALELPWFAVN
ncbi:cdc2-2D [Hordeum vulgare]|nr:cdc2-2D [Hordeum vulgare]